MTTVQDRLQWAEIMIRQSGSTTARLDAEYLLAFVLGYANRSQIYLHREPLGQGEKAAFDQVVERRMMHEPVAYITGITEFWSLPFQVNKETLIPRPDSETVISHCLDRLKDLGRDQLTILDLGTGSGCLLLSLLSEIDHATGIGVDRSQGALKLAEKNAISLGFKDRGFKDRGFKDRVSFYHGDWFKALPKGAGPFDLILSNPPYIPTDDCALLMADVRDFEPRSALDGGKDGFDAYRVIIQDSIPYLADEGILVFECGQGQAKSLKTMMQQSVFQTCQTGKDLAGIDRVVSAIKADL